MIAEPTLNGLNHARVASASELLLDFLPHKPADVNTHPVQERKGNRGIVGREAGHEAAKQKANAPHHSDGAGLP